MRHLPRTHGVSVAWLHELHGRESFEFDSVSADAVAAGISTKSTHAPAKWLEARKLINIVDSMCAFRML